MSTESRMRLAVAGGTGVVGRHVVTAVRAGGHEAVVLSRSNGIDLRDRAAVAKALDGCDAVIDVASVQTLSTRVSTDFGPQEQRMPDLVRRYLKATRRRARVIETPLPGAMGRAMRDGRALPGAGAKLGTQTFEAWLATVPPVR